MRTQSRNLEHLLTAAVVSRNFRQMLLTDAAKALEEGYENETVHLTPIERQLVLSIEATTLQYFAIRLIKERQPSQSDEHKDKNNTCNCIK